MPDQAHQTSVDRPTSAAVTEGVRLVLEEGLSMTAAASRVGCNHSAIWKRLNPERARELNRRAEERRAPTKRAWENAHRASCPSCGAPNGAGSLRADGTRRHAGDGLCPACRHSRLVANLREMVRLRREEDLSNREIAERLGMRVNSVKVRLNKCRALGIDVPCDPYNRPPSGYRRNRAKPHTVSAEMVAAVHEAFPDLATGSERALTHSRSSAANGDDIAKNQEPSR